MKTEFKEIKGTELRYYPYIGINHEYGHVILFQRHGYGILLATKCEEGKNKIGSNIEFIESKCELVKKCNITFEL